ncbi:MAG: universal stress protein [Oscillatoriaceae bacterium SKW80]|nr:universal stress protein [Oscillatoriaceae bacterium SKYG93]MCX8121729.1 universal stress protein [Oscillatoriaceae bacterium SKW80]MDW8453655.1 universal stress protein [Oscillatoriaceae cyanobacterium SKYGB_i_bin93]HIK28720.1 universal stress protein [Oscillatoriaceae cyanobacterium M7585_C2015_266]
MFKTVVFPIDQSRASREAADTVINIVKTYGSRLVLLSVVEEPVAGEELSSEGMTSPEAIAELLKNAQMMFQEHGINPEIIERQGKPAFTICDVADELGADLIIMGFKGSALIEEAAAESVTFRVMNLSPCPVLVVP